MAYCERSSFSASPVIMFVAIMKPRLGGMWVMRQARPLLRMTLPTDKRVPIGSCVLRVGRAEVFDCFGPRHFVEWFHCPVPFKKQNRQCSGEGEEKWSQCRTGRGGIRELC